jgi:glycosyltransferase involved in cell wall biosynthesis
VPLPRITIVTPSFNQAPYLEQTLRSVLDQGYPDLEYLVLDGGSTDGSVELIRKYQKQISWWRSEKDQGQSAAIREGFARATGEVLAWINSDDWYEPGALQAVGEAFARDASIDIVHGSIHYVDSAGRRLYDGHMVTDLRILAWESEFPAQQALFWKRAIYERAGGLDPALRFAMDFDLLVRMLRCGARVAKLRPVLANFRLHPQSKTTNLAEVCEAEVAGVRAREGWSGRGSGEQAARRWAARLFRFARDPRCIVSAIERRLRGY